MMRLPTLLLVLSLGLSAGVPAAADKLPLNAVSNYLNEMTTARGSFRQINDDGSVSTGTLYISRPGKMRFEYDPPAQGLVLASANAVVVFDRKSNQPPETYPLSRTPLSLILARQVDLARARMVTGHDYDGTATIVTAQDPDNAEHGTIEMSFTDDPVALRQWVINDANGGRTTVVLDGLETGVSLSNTLFDPRVALRRQER